MPWKETDPMQERMRFVLLCDEGYTISELCRDFGISRKTGYKWLERYWCDGLAGTVDRSRAPHTTPSATPAAVVAAIVQLRLRRMSWGPKKLRWELQRCFPETCWPVTSTIALLLKRAGLVRPRRRSRKTPPYQQPFAACTESNRVWSADLKGWFVTGDGRRCDPLTISDNYSRFLLRCQLVCPVSLVTVQPVFAGAFAEYGLPEVIRTDNGTPFASTSLGGLSRLSIWWLKLGILPERIAPGKPQQNGRHERMHRTLKAMIASPPKPTWQAQQGACARFRQEYNHERPHEALGQLPPAVCYAPSPRPYPAVVPEMTYPCGMALRRVKAQGDIWWQNRHVYLTDLLAGETVGLTQLDDRLWDVYFGPIRLAQLDSHTRQLVHLARTTPRRHRRSKV